MICVQGAPHQITPCSIAAGGCLNALQSQAVLVPPVGVGLVEGDEEGIGHGLAADGGGVAVAGDDVGVAGKAHDLVHDGTDEGIVVAAFQVGPADAAGEERVAGKEDAGRFAVVAHAAGRMSGRGDDPPGSAAGGERLSIRDILVVKQFHRLMQLQPVQEGGAEAEGMVIGAAHVHRATEAPDQGGDAPGMVKVTVGQEDGIGRQGVVPEEGEDLFAMAANAADLPETEKHGALYYWAKRKTVAGWIKFGLKCVAAVLLIIVASGVLYFNGLLNLIDYKAADDFEMYDSISESDFDEDEGPVYSNPESYIETTTIEGFNESMIDIPKKDVLNILLRGTDVRGGTYDERGNTDSMILISVNTRDKTIKLTSFMRDMYVYIPNRQWARLNVAYAYGGPQLLFDTLKNNFDVDVDLYVRVNFANFRKIVNHVGGVEIELTEAEAKYMNDNSEKYKTKPVEPGMQHLDGAQALSYARCRKIDSDFNRTKRQRTVIIALVDKIKHSSPGELNTLLNVFLPMIQTNMSKMQILGLMVDGTKYLNNEIETLNVPIKNSWRSELINKRSVLCPNFELNKTAIVAHVYSTYHLDVEKTKYQGFSIPNS